MSGQYVKMGSNVRCGHETETKSKIRCSHLVMVPLNLLPFVQAVTRAREFGATTNKPQSFKWRWFISGPQERMKGAGQNFIIQVMSWKKKNEANQVGSTKTN
jgi:hypothetical protein